MRIGIINNTICENVIICDSLELAAALYLNNEIAETPDGYGIGDIYNGSWSHPVNVLTPAEQREQAYEDLACIEWQGDNITVDAANDLWLKYSAEGSEIANTLSALIVTAKAEIRAAYPD